MRKKSKSKSGQVCDDLTLQCLTFYDSTSRAYTYTASGMRATYANESKFSFTKISQIVEKSRKIELLIAQNYEIILKFQCNIVITIRNWYDIKNK